MAEPVERPADERSGSFTGRLYFSETLPQGSEGATDAPFNKRLYDLANYAYYHEGQVPSDSVKVLQK